MDIKDIHEQVFQVLLKKYENDPDNFFFTLRRNNNRQRLEKGYWFHGNDWYLSVSFWSGMDWKNKTPNIYLNIHHEGGCHFFFSAKDNENKRKFAINKVFPILEELVKSQKINGESKIWGDVVVLEFSKKYSYLEVLEKFLIHLKPVIDQAVQKKLDNKYSVEQQADEDEELDETQKTWEFESVDEGHSPIDFIWPAEFKKSLDRINKYRELNETTFVEKSISWISEVKIKGVGDIRDEISIEIPEGTNWVFLTGENGCGKTTILKAIAAGFFHGELLFPSFIKSGKVDVQLFNRKQSLSSIPFAAYGPTRLISTNDDHENYPSDIRSEHWYSLFYSDEILKGLKELHHVYSDNLDGLQNAVDYLNEMFTYSEKDAGQTLAASTKGELIPQLEYVDFSDFILDKRVRFFEKDNNNVGYGQARSFNELASGVKSLVALISDLIIRFLDKNRDEADLTNFKGVVLIDEIDIHFHPSMQKQIVEILSQWFPKVQFIVTTHSPVSLLGAPKNSVIYNVTRTAKKGVLTRRIRGIDLKNLLPNALLTSPVFGMDTLIPVSNENEDKVVVDDHFDDKKLFKAVDKKIDELFNKGNLGDTKYFK